MKNSLIKYFLYFLVAVVFFSCSIQVKETYDHQVDFTKYKTFCWMEGCEFKFEGPDYLNDSSLRENLKNSIIEELKQKGLSQDTDNPDLLIGFTITVKDEQAIIYHRSEGTPIYYKPLASEREVMNYLKGSLIIGMADKAESRMVWQSHAVSYMELNPDLSQKNISRAIKIVLKNFPPTPDK